MLGLTNPDGFRALNGDEGNSYVHKILHQEIVDDNHTGLSHIISHVHNRLFNERIRSHKPA